MAFDRISILGVGLMGGSVGLACKRIASNSRIIGYTRRAEELKLAIELGAIDEGISDPAAAVAGADLVILCTPVGFFDKMMSTIGPALKPDAIVTDVGSTKRRVAALAAQLLPKHVRFVGSHPMCGSEKHGVVHARADLYDDALCIITHDDSSDPSAQDQVEQFWKSLKMRTVRMTPELHDQLTADVSHLPHAVAAALVRLQTSQSLQLAAGGFADTTRIAAGDAVLWRDILLENRDNLRAGIVRLQADLQQLLEHLDADNAAAVQQWLQSAVDVRLGFRKSATQ
jgi:prephenate dehydrogenase